MSSTFGPHQIIWWGPVNLYANSDLGFLRELLMQKGGFLDFNINKYIYDLIVKCRKLY